LPSYTNIGHYFLLLVILLTFLVFGNPIEIQAQKATTMSSLKQNDNHDQSSTINLLDDRFYAWKTWNYVKVYQTSEGLDLYVDATNKNNNDKTYYRAYLQTIELN
jgi:hypothetical protein